MSGAAQPRAEVRWFGVVLFVGHVALIVLGAVSLWRIAGGWWLGAVAAGLVTATGLRLASALGKHPLGWPLAACIALLAFIAVALLRWPLVWVLLVLGSLSCTLTYIRLGQQAAAKGRP